MWQTASAFEGNALASDQWQEITMARRVSNGQQWAIYEAADTQSLGGVDRKCRYLAATEIQDRISSVPTGEQYDAERELLQMCSAYPDGATVVFY